MMPTGGRHFLFGTMSTIDRMGSILASIPISSSLKTGTLSGGGEDAKE
jgi:hypothetical protein